MKLRIPVLSSLWSFYILKRKGEDYVPPISEDIRSLIEDLKWRSFNRQSIAYLYLVVGSVLIAGAILIFAYANRFSSISETEKKLDLLAETLALYTEAVTDQTIYDSTFLSKKFVFESGLKNLDTQFKELKEIQHREDQEFRLLRFFETLSTRIGVILIVLFLVQVFIRVFRYNTRLGAYYKARADALELSQIRPELSFDKIINLVSPDNIDIGTTKAPMAEIIETLKNIPK
jgi:hypothetical protein